jgi:hypothetical protein
MASYPGIARRAVVFAIIDFTIMSRARGCEQRRNGALGQANVLEFAGIATATLARA